MRQRNTSCVRFSASYSPDAPLALSVRIVGFTFLSIATCRDATLQLYCAHENLVKRSCVTSLPLWLLGCVSNSENVPFIGILASSVGWRSINFLLGSLLGYGAGSEFDSLLKLSAAFALGSALCSINRYHVAFLDLFWAIQSQSKSRKRNFEGKRLQIPKLSFIISFKNLRYLLDIMILVFSMQHGNSLRMAYLIFGKSEFQDLGTQNH